MSTPRSRRSSYVEGTSTSVTRRSWRRSQLNDDGMENWLRLRQQLRTELARTESLVSKKDRDIQMELRQSNDSLQTLSANKLDLETEIRDQKRNFDQREKELQGVIESLEERLATFTAEIRETQPRLRRMQNENLNLVDEVARLKTELESTIENTAENLRLEWSRKIEKVEKERDKYKIENRNLNEELEGESRQMNSQSKKVVELQATMAMMTQKHTDTIIELETALASLERENGGLRGELATVRESEAKLKTENEMLAREVEEERGGSRGLREAVTEKEKLGETNNELRMEIKDIRGALESVRERLAHAENDKNLLNLSLQDADDVLRDVEASNVALRIQVEKDGKASKSMQMRLREMEAKLKSVREERDMLLAASESRESEVQRLERVQREVTDRMAALQTELESHQIKCSRYENVIKRLNTQRQETDIETTEEQRQEIESLRDKLTAAVRQAALRNRDFEIEIEERDAEARRVKDILSSMTERARSAETSIRKLEIEIEDVTAERDSQRERTDEMERALKGARNALKSKMSLMHSDIARAHRNIENQILEWNSKLKFVESDNQNLRSELTRALKINLELLSDHIFLNQRQRDAIRDETTANLGKLKVPGFATRDNLQVAETHLASSTWGDSPLPLSRAVPNSAPSSRALTSSSPLPQDYHTRVQLLREKYKEEVDRLRLAKQYQKVTKQSEVRHRPDAIVIEKLKAPRSDIDDLSISPINLSKHFQSLGKSDTENHADSFPSSPKSRQFVDAPFTSRPSPLDPLQSPTEDASSEGGNSFSDASMSNDVSPFVHSVSIDKTP